MKTGRFFVLVHGGDFLDMMEGYEEISKIKEMLVLNECGERTRDATPKCTKRPTPKKCILERARDDKLM